MKQTFLAAWAVVVLPAALIAGELAILPPDVVLSGPNASQRLLVVDRDGAAVRADATSSAKFESSNPAVAAVDASGVVQPVGDGTAVVTAVVNGRKTTATIRVVDSHQAATWSFRNQVIPMLTRASCNSGACHGALGGKGGLKLSLRGYDVEADHFVLTRQAGGRRVDQQNPDASLLLLKPLRRIPHGGGKRFDDESPEFRIIRNWITTGASAPAASDPTITRIEIFPTAAILKPTDLLNVVVRAWYSDGRSADVTRWTRFGSTDDLVAAVDEEGMVKVAGHGEAAIHAVFSNRVALLTITSPFPTKLAPQEFTQSRRNNFIDGHVLAKLQSLGLPPSPTCTDREFIRRAYLDALGILPKPEEVEAFANNDRLDKRAKLIDSMLERPEYVDYWTYKWSDLLLVSSRKLQQPAMWAFHRFIRDSVAENKSWDRFARDVVAASGSTIHNGAANYFVLHKDVADLTETTAVTFLGMSITCCRCHNHPMEKWTQDQYWSMANLFSRVTLKNGERGGEVIVQEQRSGDVPHLRREIPMPPAPLDAEPMSVDNPASRRAYFAEWLTAPENPYFAKALVNRVWRNFMGRGLVEAEDDLRETNPPSNGPLFDALVVDFVRAKFDVKHLIRTIMNSAAYQRSSKPRPENQLDEKYYSRYIVRRLSAEVILDAYSQVTRVPTPFDKVYTGVEGGTAGTANYPLGVRALQLPDGQVASQFLNAFGRPDRLQTCSCERQQDATVGQALHLNNGQTLNDKLRSKNSIVETWLKDAVSDDEAIRRLFRVALGREPTSGERTRFATILAEGLADSTTNRREALEDLFWSVLTGREFLFNH